MEVIPIGKRIFVKPHKPIDKTDSGLHLPDYCVKYPTTGVIISMAKGVEGLKVGDVVLFGQFSGQREIINDEEIFIMTKEDINAILKE